MMWYYIFQIPIFHSVGLVTVGAETAMAFLDLRPFHMKGVLCFSRDWISVD